VLMGYVCGVHVGADLVPVCRDGYLLMGVRGGARGC